MSRSPSKQSAFTIVELLIVIVVIGILAAITIVAYNGVQERARVSSVSSALSQAAKKIAVWQVDNPSTSPADLATAGVTNSSDVSYQYTAGTSGAYCITATNGPTSYKITESTKPTAGGCAGHGVGGVSAITNLATNPNFESGVSGWPAYQGTVTQSSVWSANGTYSAKVTPNSSSAWDSFISIGASNSLIGLSVGSTYVVSATINLTAAQTGTLDGRARGITIYTWVGGVPSLIGQSAYATNAVGSTRLSQTFTVPASATGVQIRLYNGGSSTADNSVYWDSVMITQSSTQYTYADGNSPNWVWNMGTNSSTSTGPPL
jgi:prepilin-type N-terminal cleavage/methylation domain-containing protein